MFRCPVEESNASSSFAGLDHHVHSGIYLPAFLPQILPPLTSIFQLMTFPCSQLSVWHLGVEAPQLALGVRVCVRCSLYYRVTWEDEVEANLFGLKPCWACSLFFFPGGRRQVSAGRASLISHLHVNLALRLCFQGTQTKTNPMWYYYPYCVGEEPEV